MAEKTIERDETATAIMAELKLVDKAMSRFLRQVKNHLAVGSRIEFQIGNQTAEGVVLSPVRLKFICGGVTVSIDADTAAKLPRWRVSTWGNDLTIRVAWSEILRKIS